jgi:hypothetical protein
MTAVDVLATLHDRGARVWADGADLVVDAPKGVVTPELRHTLTTHKAELLAVLRTPATLTDPTFDADAGELAAVKLRNTIIGDCWLLADAEALAEHLDIIRSRLPVFFFDEVEMLSGKTLAELKAIGVVKATFPTSRVLQ